MGCANTWIIYGAVLGGLSVVTGAFAAHGLDAFFMEKYAGQSHTVMGEEIPSAAKYLGDFKTAAQYQMYHALALIGVGLLMQSNTSRLLNVTGWSFLLGILLFSGSLYVLTLTGIRILGAITPIGGVLFLVGWAMLAVAAYQSAHGKQSQACAISTAEIAEQQQEMAPTS